MTSLFSIDLGQNYFSGQIDAVAGLTQLYFLSLNKNKLDGPIHALSHLSFLYFLQLDYNQLSGGLEALAFLTNCQSVTARNNYFRGSGCMVCVFCVTWSPSRATLSLSGRLSQKLARVGCTIGCTQARWMHLLACQCYLSFRLQITS